MTQESSSPNEVIHTVEGGLPGDQSVPVYHYFNFFKPDEEKTELEETPKKKKKLKVKRKGEQVQNGGVKKKKKKKKNEHENECLAGVEITKSGNKDEEVVGEKPDSDISSQKLEGPKTKKKKKKKKIPRELRKTFKDDYKKIAEALKEEETKNKPNRTFDELMSDKSYRGGRKESYNRKKLQKIRQARATAQ